MRFVLKKHVDRQRFRSRYRYSYTDVDVDVDVDVDMDIYICADVDLDIAGQPSRPIITGYDAHSSPRLRLSSPKL